MLKVCFLAAAIVGLGAFSASAIPLTDRGAPYNASGARQAPVEGRAAVGEFGVDRTPTGAIGGGGLGGAHDSAAPVTSQQDQIYDGRF